MLVDMKRQNQMNKRTYLVTCRSRKSRVLGAIIVASTLTVGIARAQTAITAPTRNSQSGIQSIITQKRDELQRQVPASRQRPQHQQRAAKNPDAHSSDR